jgi:hypothetical protein
MREAPRLKRVVAVCQAFFAPIRQSARFRYMKIRRKFMVKWFVFPLKNRSKRAMCKVTFKSLQVSNIIRLYFLFTSTTIYRGENEANAEAVKQPSRLPFRYPTSSYPGTIF